MSISFSVDDFPCPLRSIATTLAFSLIIPADIANDSLAIACQRIRMCLDGWMDGMELLITLHNHVWLAVGMEYMFTLYVINIMYSFNSTLCII